VIETRAQNIDFFIHIILKELFSPCLSKLSSRKMQTNARNLFTSRKYKIVPLFNLIKLELWLSNAAASKSSLNLNRYKYKNINDALNICLFARLNHLPIYAGNIDNNINHITT